MVDHGAWCVAVPKCQLTRSSRCSSSLRVRWKMILTREVGNIAARCQRVTAHDTYGLLTPLRRVTLALKDPPIHRRGDGRCGSAIQYGDRCRLRDITACHHLSGIRKSSFHSSLLATPSPERAVRAEQTDAGRLSPRQLFDGSCLPRVCSRDGLTILCLST